MQPHFRSFSTFGDCMLQLKKRPGPVATLNPQICSLRSCLPVVRERFLSFFPSLANWNKPPAATRLPSDGIAGFKTLQWKSSRRNQEPYCPITLYNGACRLNKTLPCTITHSSRDSNPLLIHYTLLASIPNFETVTDLRGLEEDQTLYGVTNNERFYRFCAVPSFCKWPHSTYWIWAAVASLENFLREEIQHGHWGRSALCDLERQSEGKLNILFSPEL